MGRPRKYKRNIPNLYQKTDKRNGKTYFNYRDPNTGDWFGFGSDREAAEIAARKLNEDFAARRVSQWQHLLDHNQHYKKECGISTASWCEKFIAMQKSRLENEEISSSTFKNTHFAVKRLKDIAGHLGIKEVNTKLLASELDSLKAEGKLSMARNLKHKWIEVFDEAQHSGEVEAGFNPAKATRRIIHHTKRERLLIGHWLDFYSYVLEDAPRYFIHALKLALTTGLRPADLCSLRFRDIKDGYLCVETNKSRGKTKLAFPMGLTNPLIGESLEDIINACRQTGVISQYLVHVSEMKFSQGKKSMGKPLSVVTLSARFRAYRDDELSPVKGATFTFYELRSLAERTYREIGIDTQKLLGHKSAEMTNKYNDDRLESYTIIELTGTHK